MVILDLKLDNIYCFNDFEINFSYPKKIVNSVIEEEILPERPNFRYKKVVVLMGPNATGKTCLGKAIYNIFKFLKNEDYKDLLSMRADTNRSTSLSIDFVNDGCKLQRLLIKIPASKDSKPCIYHQTANINKNDNYNKAVVRLKERCIEYHDFLEAMKGISSRIGQINNQFAYPEIQFSKEIEKLDQELLLKIFKAVIGTLDSSLSDISVSKDLKNTFIIRRKQEEIIIQEGKLLNKEILSSGTTEGIDVAVLLANMFSGNKGFYYCDEHFSYIHSDIEKRIFGIMLGKLGDSEQLIFTTHNTDMLDLNLPKHSYAFLSKRMVDGEPKILSLYASDILKRNTDSLRCAVENDVFASLPDDSLLDELE